MRSDNLDFACLAYATRRSGRAVTNYFNGRMAHLGLNVGQFGLLHAVARMPGATLAQIGETMLLDDSTMARNFGVLERRGLVGAEGGRGRAGKHVHLTRAGQKLYDEAVLCWRQANRRLAAEFAPAELEAGRAFLHQLGQAAEALKAIDDAGREKDLARRA